MIMFTPPHIFTYTLDYHRLDNSIALLSDRCHKADLFILLV